MRNLNPHTFYFSAFNFSYSTLMNYLWSRNTGILIYYTWWYKPMILKYILNYFVCKYGWLCTYDSMGVGIRRQLVAITCCLLSYVALTSNSSSWKAVVFTCWSVSRAQQWIFELLEIFLWPSHGCHSMCMPPEDKYTSTTHTHHEHT